MSPAPNTTILRPKVAGENAPEFSVFAEDTLSQFGYVSLTIFEWVPERSALKRIYSSDQERFPVNGEKHMPLEAPWPQTVIGKQQPHITRNEDEIKATYNDFQSILDSGIGAIYCFPVVDAQGQTIGVYNFSGAPGSYVNDREAMETFVLGEGQSAMVKYFARTKGA